jgi:Transcriptional regulators
MLLGVVMLETNFYAGNSILQAVQAAARERGYFVTNSSTSSIDLAAVKTASDRLIDQGVDGQILAVPVRDVAELKEVLGPVPAVVIDGTGGQSDASANQIEIGRAATRHLLELGHKTVWHVAGPDTWGDASARTEGWHEELVKSGCEVPPLLYGDWTPESGYRNGLLLGRIDDATAIFVSSDEMAIGLIAGLREMGRQVPGDVSVIGVDDIALARYSNPALTTWRQPFEEVGFQAVDLLLQHLDDITAIATVDTPLGELVIRDSTAAIDTAS